MTLQAKSKKHECLEAHAAPIRSQTEDTSANHKHSREEIRLRAYEIYIARCGQAGNELEDWLQAERELAHAAGTKATGLGIEKS